MLISFLAALEDGVNLESHATTRSSQSTERGREGRARVGLPALGSLLNLDMSGRLSSKSGNESDEQITAVRRHTEASLFNRLRLRLFADREVTLVESTQSLDGLRTGMLVEVPGQITGNPLLQMSQVLFAMAPFTGFDIEALMAGKYEKPAPKPKPNAAPAPTPPVDPDGAAGLRLFFTMVMQIMNAPVRDIVLTSDFGLSTVLGLETTHVEELTDAHTYQSEVRVLGKLTRVIGSGDEAINLTRRSSLGMMPSEQVAEMVQGARDALGSEMNVKISDPFVGPPAIQVLPLAIFV
ncbi:MAG TPA: hypothetical protein VHV75_12230 [Solirubrobacteraceae bacterium]|jgi:hypothetical protein|nr:hypothetical protein [Solirubrobacteraceae bacterium]